MGILKLLSQDRGSVVHSWPAVHPGGDPLWGRLACVPVFSRLAFCVSYLTSEIDLVSSLPALPKTE